MITIKKSHVGLLREQLGAAKGKPIPAKKLAKAAHSDNPVEKKRAVFAENAKKWNHGDKGKPSAGPVASPNKPKNPDGNPGYHGSTKEYEHAGSTHTSEDR